MDEVKERVIKLEVIQDRISSNQTSLTASIGEIAKSMQKQEVLLQKQEILFEKLITMEETLATKADKTEVALIQEKLDDLESVRFFVKRPLMFMVLVITTSLLFIKEIRDKVFTMLGIY